jgi:hypothetical protein
MCKLLVVNEHKLETKRYISTTPRFCLFYHTEHHIRISMFRCGLVNRGIPLNTGGVRSPVKTIAKILSYNVLRGPDNQLRDQTCSLADEQPSSAVNYCTVRGC